MSFDVAATTDLLRHKFREIVVPMLDGVESQYLDWIPELPCKQVGYDSLDVSSLGSRSAIVWRMRRRRFYNHINRLIGPEGDNG